MSTNQIFTDVMNEQMEERLEALSQEMFHKAFANCTKSEIYNVVLQMTKDMIDKVDVITGDKKVYYISAEFLIGKLLSNNLINLGIYDKLSEVLEKNGVSLAEIEEVEPEPSLGNGGLGRLAACFLDSIATLGLPGDGIGLNYHFGLFKQVFKDRIQCAEKNDWIEENSWLRKTDVSYDVYFGDKKVKSRLYDIDVVGYNNGVNKLHLFDIESIDESLVKKGIEFDKEDIEKNLTLFLYPDDSDEAGNLLRIYQQYFMVSNGAQLILQDLKERHVDLREMYKHAVIQINDTHPTMVIPELIRILTEDKAMSMDDAIEVVSKTCAYTNHTILAEALEKWPLKYLEKAVPQLVPIIRSLIRESEQSIKILRCKLSMRMTECIWLTLTFITEFQLTVLQHFIQKFLRSQSLRHFMIFILRSSIIRQMVSHSEDGLCLVTESLHHILQHLSVMAGRRMQTSSKTL